VGALNLLLLPLLVYASAARGAAWALVIAETVGPILMLWVLRRHRQRIEPQHSS
jgi:Na+-driven multidrug efflux pump